MSFPSASIYLSELGALASAAAALPKSDVESAARFSAARRRDQSLGSRALLRAALRAHGVQGDPGIVTRDDRPQVAEMPALSVSLSHTGDWVACALSATPCGVDIQRKIDKPMLEIAQSYFTPEEHADLEALGGAARADLFYAWWTLKEAWAKASGVDLLPALSRVRVARAGEDASDDWSAWSFAPSAQVAGALVVRGPADDASPLIEIWRGDAFERANFECTRVALALRHA